jgi:hypothetical protein
MGGVKHIPERNARELAPTGAHRILLNLSLVAWADYAGRALTGQTRLCKRHRRLCRIGIRHALVQDSALRQKANRGGSKDEDL